MMLIAGLLFPCLPAGSQQKEKEYRLKAAFLYRFASFVSWPKEAFEADDSPLILAVLGDEAFGKVLERTIKSNKVRGREILIHTPSNYATSL